MYRLKLLFLSIFLLFSTSCNEAKEQKESKNLEQVDEVLDTFDLTGIFNQRYKLSLGSKKITLTNKSPIVIINLFKDECEPCIIQMKYLDRLQKEYHKSIFTISITNRDISDKKLLNIVSSNNLDYLFVKTTKESKLLFNRLKNRVINSLKYRLPLTIIYLKGDYFTHYEGVIPFEMMSYDIKEAKKMLNLQKKEIKGDFI